MQPYTKRDALGKALWYDKVMSEKIDRLVQKHAERKHLHITRVMGSLVVVSDGEIIDVDRSEALSHCPLQHRLSDAGIEEHVREKMREFGHFSCHRDICRSSFAVPFGASEIMMCALESGVLDCAVTVCDGAGTVITGSPEIVQGIGARMNGVFYTTAIPEVQDRLRQCGAIVFDDGRIDQVAGIETALKAGYGKIGVTLNTYHGEAAAALRRFQTRAKLFVLAICSTGADSRRAEEVSSASDLTWACASRHMRRCGSKAMMQVTTGIPVFVTSEKGIELLGGYSNAAGKELLAQLPRDRQYLLASRREGEMQVTLGQNTLWITEQALPVASRNQPCPLS